MALGGLGCAYGEGLFQLAGGGAFAERGGDGRGGEVPEMGGEGGEGGALPEGGCRPREPWGCQRGEPGGWGWLRTHLVQCRGFAWACSGGERRPVAWRCRGGAQPAGVTWGIWVIEMEYGCGICTEKSRGVIHLFLFHLISHLHPQWPTSQSQRRSTTTSHRTQTQNSHSMKTTSSTSSTRRTTSECPQPHPTATATAHIHPAGGRQSSRMTQAVQTAR